LTQPLLILVLALFAGDGAECGANISIEQLQFVILNEGCEIVSPAFHYTVGLFDGKEDISNLRNNLSTMSEEMRLLELNGLEDPITKEHWDSDGTLALT
jgi:hypothetical protein